MTRRLPRLTRAHAVALLLQPPAGQPARTDARDPDGGGLSYTTPDDFWARGVSRLVLTRPSE